MAPYLATATVGEYKVKKYAKAGIAYWDALDPKLFTPPATPRTGSQLAFTRAGEPSYQRLTRTIDVPAGGASLSFHVTRDTEPQWDFFFVEAHTAGADDWTTLPDANGHSESATGAVCAYGPQTHPFLAHYVTPGPDDACLSSGSSGTWSAASGRSAGYEQWSVDLSAWAGRRVEVSLSSVNDPAFTFAGAFVDDVVVSTGQGTTSFEDDGDTLDGWVPGGPPPGSPANPNTWIVGTVVRRQPGGGEVAGHLAQRGLRDLRGVAVERPGEARHGAGDLNQYYEVFDNPEFWALPIGDPGPEHLFDYQVYVRGAMTLHALRLAVGDQAFFTILRSWASTRRGGTVTTPEFIDLAERISGRSLDALFQAWLFSPTRPEVATPPAAAVTGLKVRVPSPMVDRRSRS